MERVAKPTVVSSELSRPYWEAAAQGRLVLQHCGACGVVRHYPRMLCTECYSAEVEWRGASGRGQVHSWTVAHHAFHAGFKDDLPYTLVTVDLEEGVRALGRWSGAETPRIGVAVQGSFQIREGGIDLVFAPSDAR
jgi:uncharacterized protein